MAESERSSLITVLMGVILPVSVPLRRRMHTCRSDECERIDWATGGPDLLSVPDSLPAGWHPERPACRRYSTRRPRSSADSDILLDWPGPPHTSAAPLLRGQRRETSADHGAFPLCGAVYGHAGARLHLRDSAARKWF